MQTKTTLTRNHIYGHARVMIMLISLGLMTLASAASAQSHRDHHRDRHYEPPRYEREYQRGYDRHHKRHHHERRSERRERAHRYAERAVDQAHEARWYGYRFDHPRWSTRYRGHFRWALGASHKEIRREIRKRERRLREIRQHAHYYDKKPRHYGRRHPN